MEGRATQQDETSTEPLESFVTEACCYGDGTEGAQTGLSQTAEAGSGHSILENRTLGYTLSCLVTQNYFPLNTGLGPLDSSHS